MMGAVHQSARRIGHVVALIGFAALAGCNAKTDTAAEDTKKQNDQLLAANKDVAAQTKASAETGRTTAEQLKTLSTQIDALQKAITTGFASQKRGALSLRLDTDASCDNDADCSATARAICNRVNYPNALAAHFTPGLRPTLQSLVCFD